MAGDFGSPGFGSWRASAAAPRYVNDSVAGSNFTHGTYQGAPRNRVKLWSQSASRGPAVIDPMIPDAILDSSQLRLPRHRPLLALQEGFAAVRSAPRCESRFCCSPPSLRASVSLGERSRPLRTSRLKSRPPEKQHMKTDWQQRGTMSPFTWATQIFMPTTRNTIRPHTRSN